MEYWALGMVGLAVLLILGLVGWRRWRRQRRRRWLKRMQGSLCSWQDGTLRVRTLWEDSADLVFGVAYANKLVRAAERASRENPLLSLDTDDYRICLEAVSNRVSAAFAAGFVRRDLGAHVRSACFVIGLVHENVGATHRRKLRVLMVRHDLLEDFPETMPQLENPDHEVRWRSLQVMAQVWRDNPIRLGRVELVLAD